MFYTETISIRDGGRHLVSKMFEDRHAAKSHVGRALYHGENVISGSVVDAEGNTILDLEKNEAGDGELKKRYEYSGNMPEKVPAFSMLDT